MKGINRKKMLCAALAIVLIVGLTHVINLLVQYLIYPREYSEHVSKYAKEFDVPEYVVYSVIKVESGFDSDAVSQKGASGLMQLMPATYRWLAKMKNESVGNIFDVEENIKYGTYYLSILYERYGNWTYALCAYNAGMGNVDKWIKVTPFYIQFLETQNYVNKLEVAMGKYKSLYYE